MKLILVRILHGRVLSQTLMRTKSIVEIDPGLNRSQEISKSLIGTRFRHSKLEVAHKALGIAIIGRVQLGSWTAYVLSVPGVVAFEERHIACLDLCARSRLQSETAACQSRW
jgi:hypothetical protein